MQPAGVLEDMSVEDAAFRLVLHIEETDQAMSPLLQWTDERLTACWCWWCG
jgi:hypothetical protein